MKRLLALLCLLMLPATALAAKTRTKWTDVPEVVRPGKSVRMIFTCPVETTAVITLLDTDGETAATLAENYQTSVGENSLTWDGTSEGTDVAPGKYTLRIALSGKKAETSLTVGEHAPELLDVDGELHLSADWALHVDCSVPGTIVVQIGGAEVLRADVDAGETDIPWDGTVDGASLPDGAYELEIQLVDATGFASTASLLNVEVEGEPQPALMHDVDYHTPSDVDCEHDICYWKLNMGEMDAAAIWQVLTAPVTVLKGNERQQAKVYAEPSAKSAAIAEVTYSSQAVHVLERGEEWTKIEGYSSSVEGSSVANYGGHFVGYVQSSLLKEKEVNQHIGIVVDKLTQRLYLFHNGERVTEMLVATGLIQDGKYYCETIPGEYITISRTGGFYSGNMYCDMAIRINGGILLHEVPCKVRADGSHDYSSFEGYLGTKQSHGCIRIQRLKNNEGYNHKWLWNNLPMKTRVIIWDDLNRTDSPSTWYPNP